MCQFLSGLNCVRIMEAILRLKRVGQFSEKRRDVTENAFVKIRRLGLAAKESAKLNTGTVTVFKTGQATARLKTGGVSAVKKITSESTVPSTGTGSVRKKTGVKRCFREDCLLNVAKVVHSTEDSGEDYWVPVKKICEGVLPGRGKLPRGPGGARRAPKGAEAPPLPAKGGRPLTGPLVKGGHQMKGGRIPHEKLVEQLARNAEKNVLNASVLKQANAARLANLQHSVADSTAKNYEYWWERFTTFCWQNGLEEMPFGSETAALFLWHLAEQSPGVGGVTNARAALIFYFKLKFPDVRCPADGAEVKSVVRGVRRRFEKPTVKKAPLAPDDFYKILASATQNGNFQEVKLCQFRLAAQVALMYTTFSRYEESAVLRCSQVSKNKDDLVISFLKGKTYQHGEARCAVIASQPGILNPVTVILKYMDRLQTVHKAADGLLFPALTFSAKGDGVLQKPASYRAVLKLFKAAVVESGVAADSSSYGLHSMRRGAATTAANNGASVHVIQKQMRVMTAETVKRYSSLNSDTLKTACSAVFQKI